MKKSRARILAVSAIVAVGIGSGAAALAANSHDTSPACAVITNAFGGLPTGFNPYTATNAQLAAVGLPMRPTDENSAAYQAWKLQIESAEQAVSPELSCAPVQDHSSREPVGN